MASADQENQEIEEVLSLLEARKLVLMVGAGSSVSVGYPLWSRLLEDLRTKLEFPSVQDSSEGTLAFADKVQRFARENGKINDYHSILYEIFKPRSKSNHNQFHGALVRLGFRAITTTNYDEVLEHAINANLNPKDGSGSVCMPLDLCKLDYPYPVLKYLRELGGSDLPPLFSRLDLLARRSLSRLT